MWSDCLLDHGTDFLVSSMVFVWDTQHGAYNPPSQNIALSKQEYYPPLLPPPLPISDARTKFSSILFSSPDAFSRLQGRSLFCCWLMTYCGKLAKSMKLQHNDLFFKPATPSIRPSRNFLRSIALHLIVGWEWDGLFFTCTLTLLFCCNFFFFFLGGGVLRFGKSAERMTACKCVAFVCVMFHSTLTMYWIISLHGVHAFQTLTIIIYRCSVRFSIENALIVFVYCSLHSPIG